MELKDYIQNVAAEVIGWFLGAALGVLALRDWNIEDPLVWKAALVAGAVGVLKGLASRFVPGTDPNSGSLRR